VLLGAPVVVALMRDRGDDAGLSGLPADGWNFRQRPQFRACAVRSDDEAGPEAFASG
jgi:hypothetical protein